MLASAPPRRLSCPVDEEDAACRDPHIIDLCLAGGSRRVTGTQCKSIATIHYLRRRRCAARDDLRTGRADQEQSARAFAPARRMENGHYNQFASTTSESSRNSDGSLIERQLLRGILLEMIYRDERALAAGTTLVEPPDWLVEGALTLTPGRERKVVVEALSGTDKGKSLEEFLGQRFDLLDSAGRVLYRAYSIALVQLLLDEGGRTRLARYIANLSHASNDPVPDLKARFPQLREDLEKKWRSTVARLGENQTYRLPTFAESERRLEEVLQIKISDGSRNREQQKAADLSELARRKASGDEKTAVSQMSQALLLVIGTVHPVLR